MSHTYALLEVSAAAYDEIKQKLIDAGYRSAINEAAEIDMHGIALVRNETGLRPLKIDAKCAVCGRRRGRGTMTASNTFYCEECIEKRREECVELRDEGERR